MGNISFLLTRVPYYHMDPWYNTHMVFERYAIEMGINRLKIDWRAVLGKTIVRNPLRPTPYIFP